MATRLVQMKMLFWLTLYLCPPAKMKHRECWDGGKLNSWEGLTEPVDFGGVLVASFPVFLAERIGILSDRIVCYQSHRA